MEKEKLSAPGASHDGMNIGEYLFTAACPNPRTPKEEE
jgi:hypothetical protein